MLRSIIIRSSIFVALVSLVCSASQAQWIHTNGPLRTSALTYCNLGNVILVGTTSGVFRSIDQGSSWQYSSNGLPDNADSVYSIVALGGKLYTVIDSGIYRSNDTGSTWHRTSSAPSFRKFGTLGTSDSVIYYFGKDFYRSADAGASWIRIDSSLSKLAHPATGLFVGNTFYAAGSWIIQSTNEGRTWNVVAVPPADTNWEITSICNIGNALFFTDQQLDNLRRLGPNMPVERAGLHLGIIGNRSTLVASNGSMLVAANGSRIFRSFDSARSWQQIAVIKPAFGEIQSLTFVGTEFLACYNNYGIFRSVDSGIHWSTANQGLYALNASVIATGANTLAVGTNDGLFISTDRGDSWQSQTTGLPDAKIGSLLFDRYAWYVGGSTLQKSHDFGTTWIRANQHPNLNYVRAMARSGNNIMAGGHPDANANGFAVTTDDGITWSSSRVTSAKPGEVEPYCFSVSSNFALAATSRGVYRSADKGDSWRDSNFGLDEQNPPIINTIAQAGLHCILSRVAADSTIKGAIFVSSDAGFSWARAQDTSVPDRGIVTAFATVDSYLFAATDSSGIFLTTDAGAHWTPVSTGLQDSTVLALAIQGEDLIACTGSSGVWRRPLKEMIPYLGVKPPNTPQTFSVYPNPASSTISITFADITGEVQATFISEIGATAATRSVSIKNGSGVIDVKALTAGSYFLKLRVGDKLARASVVIK